MREIAGLQKGEVNDGGEHALDRKSLPSQRPPLGRAWVGRCLGALDWFFGGGAAATCFSGMPRRAAASFALLMLIVPASGGPPQPQQLRSVPAVMIAIGVVPIVLLFIPNLSAGQTRIQPPNRTPWVWTVGLFA